MAQLLSQGINTVNFTNAVLRNMKNFNDYVILRSDGMNTPEFSTLSSFKDLVLDIGRQVNSEIITDIGLIKLTIGKNITLNEVDNRLILCLENSSVFSTDDKRYTPNTGDLIWTNETISISNSSDNISLLLVIDFKEYRKAR
jgi:hypothetical protein